MVRFVGDIDLREFINWLTNLFTHQCEGCVAREQNIHRLMEENRDLRIQMKEVIETQKSMLRDILKLDRPQVNRDNVTPMPINRRPPSIQSRLKEAEQKDMKEYNDRIKKEANEVLSGKS